MNQMGKCKTFVCSFKPSMRYQTTFSGQDFLVKYNKSGKTRRLFHQIFFPSISLVFFEERSIDMPFFWWKWKQPDDRDLVRYGYYWEWMYSVIWLPLESYPIIFFEYWIITYSFLCLVVTNKKNEFPKHYLFPTDSFFKVDTS